MTGAGGPPDGLEVLARYILGRAVKLDRFDRATAVGDGARVVLTLVRVHADRELSVDVAIDLFQASAWLESRILDESVDRLLERAADALAAVDAAANPPPRPPNPWEAPEVRAQVDAAVAVINALRARRGLEAI